MKYQIISLLYLIFFLTSSAYEVGINFIHDYKFVPYEHSGQTWQIGVYDRDYVFFAHKEGVIQFDGTNWTLVPLDNKMDVRSVFADTLSRRIYVGGINEFGYIAPDTSGRLIYTNLSDSIGDKRNIGNIWGLFVEDRTIFAQGDANVLKYTEGKTTIVQSPEKLNCSNLIDGILYLGTENGLRQLVGNKISPAYGTEALKGSLIRSILKYNDGVLICTASDGIYYYDGKSLNKIYTNHEGELSQSEIFVAAILDNKLALGTISDGLIILDLETDQLVKYDKGNGLTDNTVLAIAFDKSRSLWAGLNNGINFINLSDKTTTLGNDGTLGAGYTVVNHNGHLYIGTNRGLYTDSGNKSNSNTSLSGYSLVGPLEGQVWNLVEIGDELMCMHDRGLYLIDGKNARQIGLPVGTWLVQPFKNNPDKLWVGTYTGMYAMEKTNSGWKVISTVNDLNESAFNFVQLDADKILLNRNVNGTLKIEIDTISFFIKGVKEYKIENVAATPNSIHLSTIDNEIYLTSTDGIYRYDKASDALIKADDITRKLIGDVPYYRLIKHGDYLFALTPNEVVRSRINGNHAVERMILKPAAAKPMYEGESLYALNDSLVIMPNFNGFTIYDFSDSDNKNDATRRYARINKMYVGDSLAYTSNYQQHSDVVRLKYDDNSIKIEFGVNNPLERGITSYSYRLNDDDWIYTTTDNIKEYTELREGKYTFELKTLTIDGSEYSDSISFTIAPPWYRTIWAYIIYCIIAIIAALLAFSLIKRRVSQRQQIIINEKNDRIMQLESEKLQSELDHKSQEVVNLLIALSNKNETLNALKEDIQKAYSLSSGNPDARKMLLTVLNRISDSTSTESILKRVEKEFDLLHNNFFKNIRARYPDLSNNEIIMCSYLKMNLSTKEIAPLLNMSVRGVETMRYRIRKKFSLEREDNLADFLNQII